ncbi:MAG TPA: sugar phosphorylase [Chloroflexota bacterium]
MRDKIKFLYPDRADEVADRTDGLLNRYRAEHPVGAARTPRFSANDAVLICYGDHVQEPHRRPLETLNSFLDCYVRDSIPRVHILPFFPYSSDDGFSVIDYYRVNDELGDWPDVERIADGSRLMFDLVINHVSAQSQWFQRFLAGDPIYRDYFLAFDQPADMSSVFRPRTHPLLTPFWTTQGERYVWTTFSDDQIDLNFANPDVLLQFIDILLFYIARGATIIRLDAIAYLWKELGTSCIHLPQTHAVVKLFRQILDEIAPDVWIITETNVPHADNVSYFGNGSDEAHLVYNFALPPLLLYSLVTGDASDLTRWAKSLAPPSSDTAFFNFTASHDGIGVTALRELIPDHEFRRVLKTAEARGGRINYRSVPGQDAVPYELNIVYMDAVGGVRPFLASQAIALALQGVPAVYFNSLIGAENWAEGVRRLGYNRAINRQKFDYEALTRELEDPTTIKHRVYQAYSRLLRVRRAEPAFSPLAEQQVIDLDPRVFAVLRGVERYTVLALTNVSGEPAELNPAIIRRTLGKSRARDIATGRVRDLTVSVRLEPYEVAWLK